jgi:FkbM family methyltransferase
MNNSQNLFDLLRDNFVIVNLGCIGDEDLQTPDAFKKVTTLVEIDAYGESSVGGKYHRRICIKQAVSGTPGKRIFRRNNLIGTSSLLNPRDNLVKAYALEEYWKALERTEVNCDSLPNLLAAQNVRSVDFLKTDLEGLDFEVIKSCEPWLGRIQFIQAELRFEPLYESERPFHEVVSYLAGFGYEVLDITHIDRWVYKTAHRSTQVEGRATWGDFLFVLSPDRLPAAAPERTAEAIAKQILIASLLGKKNYAEHLLERFESVLPAEWVPDLKMAIQRFRGIKKVVADLRLYLRPFEFFLRHLLGRSEHSALKY